ncbi:hypothetical protein CKY47_24625 [Saccharothrix yanglingensis]|uniref:Uncharacterized protein n=1 Tax=Saccharothrix yanglingensis TaxID=659496 RepID=A0ABU0X523_9PSEU|nr:hypothetical protein [Saccharothrix yanglingensis]
MQQTGPEPEHARYAPQGLPVTRRIAAYTANLVVLAVVVKGAFVASSLGGSSGQRAWQSLAFLWRSQVSAEEWDSLTEVLDIRIRQADSADVEVELRRGAPVFDRVDVDQLFYDVKGEVGEGYFFSALDVAEFPRWERFCVSDRGYQVLHLVEPLMENLEPNPELFIVSDGRARSVSHLLLVVPTSQSEERRAGAFEACLTHLSKSGADFSPCWTILFDAPARDDVASLSMLRLVMAYGDGSGAEADSLIGCALRFLRSGGDWEEASPIFARYMSSCSPKSVAESPVCLIELGFNLSGPPITGFARDVRSLLGRLDLRTLAEVDRGLVARLKQAATSQGLADAVEWPTR